VNLQEARRVLGLNATADDAAIREAHRRRIRQTHPDVGGSAREAALVNEAFDALSGRVPDERSSAPTQQPPVRHEEVEDLLRPDDVDHFFVIDERPTDLLVRLAEAGHCVGEVVFVDPHVGLLEIVVGEAPGVGQLAVTVGDEQAGGTPVSFTLDPLGVTPAPPIDAVVAQLMAALSL
jgi:hypothetical protein